MPTRVLALRLNDLKEKFMVVESLRRFSIEISVGCQLAALARRHDWFLKGSFLAGLGILVCTLGVGGCGADQQHDVLPILSEATSVVPVPTPAVTQPQLLELHEDLRKMRL